ncbi:hypothetical protein AIOL_004050 [Candidatus Rhodobacter oscarellae]|uniref:DUF306 domain-containing protein n=1 Tax=Candidatus Rhodobacter oscarellae TaxID=1675527 RepID=A0A0J9EBJ2_9RHOB|nr:hypothetical protein [Candidatus Rhodobacter lobularis]KMW59069.1 hypothetical protein AIOL_004050 [Candidatus Rhodobacter lobularis]
MLCDVILPLIWLTFCQTDETLAAYAGRDRVFRLAEMQDRPVDEAVTLRFPARKTLELRTTCGQMAGRITAPLPWFALSLERGKDQDCDARALHDNLYNLINGMHLAEIAGDTILLQDDHGATLLFRAGD